MLTNPRDAMLCRRAKFGEDRMLRGRVIAYFSIFKMAAVRHLGFSYFRNFCEKFRFAPLSSSCKIR